MPDESKPKEEIQNETASESEEKVEEPKTTEETKTAEETTVETAKEEVEQESAEEEKAEEEVKEEQKVEEKQEDKKELAKASKKEKAETKKEPAKKADKKDEDFQYIVRISNTDIDGDKNIVYGLTSIKGIGMHMATFVMEKTGMDRNLKMGKLSESQIKKLQDAIDSISNEAPEWMLNHRKDYDSGEDIHLIGPDIDLKLRDEINVMKKIRSYRGIRHERGLPCRGQRTRANNRKGLSLGVSKKRV